MTDSAARDPWVNIQHVTAGAVFDSLGLAHRVRIPPAPGKHPALVMVHGLDGNEDVTWIFARAAAPDWLIVSPRAPIDSHNGGYRWFAMNDNGRSDVESFTAGAAALERFIDRAIAHYPIDPARVTLLGFSQGSVMAATYALTHRRPLALLSGFLPRELPIPALDGLPVLILHGTRDETVPIRFAHDARERLEAAGARVTYEESDIGHKLSAQGMRTLAAWLAQRLSAPTE